MQCDCGGQCGGCGLLSGFLGALLPAGSQVKTGFELGVSTALGAPGLTQSIADNLRDTIEGCVYATGGFSQVSVLVDWHYLSSLASVTVAVTTVNDHGDINDVGNWIGGAIASCVPDVEIVSQSQTFGQGSTDAAGHPIPQGSTPPVTAPPGVTPPPSGQCVWSQMGFFDYLACQLGVTRTAATAIGIAGGIVIAMMITARR